MTARSPQSVADRIDASGLWWPIDAATVERLSRFFDLRGRWARTHNLSGPRALADPWADDLLDGVAVAATLDRGLPLVDVGAGSGVPGLVVACLLPDQPVVLVEPIAKRTAFLRSAAARLGLRAARVHRARWPIELDEAVQVVSRAVIDPAVWPELAASAGPRVVSIIRLLAAHRPPMSSTAFQQVTAHDYAVGSSLRRVERWLRPHPIDG